MKNSIKVLTILILGLFVTSSVSGQTGSREYIRNAIKNWGSCRNVAITKTNGDLALYGRNGWAHSGCPDGLVEALEDLSDDGEYIDDVQLTESGRWLILYGNNGFKYSSNIPYSLERKLHEYNERGDVVTSVTFNDAGSWIIISTEHFSTSSTEVTNWLKEGVEECGKLWAACVTDDALVAVFDRGYRFMGDVPESLKTALRETSLDVYRLKISGGSWFFADKNSKYKYRM